MWRAVKDGHPQEPGRRLNRLRGRGKAAAGAVGSDGIVLAPPLLDQHGRLRQRVEDLPVQQLVGTFLGRLRYYAIIQASRLKYFLPVLRFIYVSDRAFLVSEGHR